MPSKIRLDITVPAPPEQGVVDLVTRQAVQTLETFMRPEEWIANLPVPAWDQWFMAQIFVSAMRSPDQQTKQGGLIVNWNTKAIIGNGFNGHPCKSKPWTKWDSSREGLAMGRGQPFPNEHTLPTVREGTSLPNGGTQGKPDKYNCMAHADLNAVIRAAASGPCDHAVAYLPMPPCENCLLAINNLQLADIHVRRIVYLEDRDFPNTRWLANSLPHIALEAYAGPHPAEVLENAARYARLRTSAAAMALSERSTKTYS